MDFVMQGLKREMNLIIEAVGYLINDKDAFFDGAQHITKKQVLEKVISLGRERGFDIDRLSIIAEEFIADEDVAGPRPYVTAWNLYGRNICTIGENMSFVMKNTKADVEFSDVVMPTGKNCIYFESDCFGALLPDKITGMHKLKGVMVHKKSKKINVMFWGEPKLADQYNLTQDNIVMQEYSDTYTSICLTDSPGISLDQQVRQQTKFLALRLVNEIGFHNLFFNYDEFEKGVREVILMIINTIMYWESFEVERYQNPDWKSLEAHIKEIKTKMSTTRKKGYLGILKKELRKSERKLKDVVGRYYIETTPIESKGSDDSTGTHKSPVQHLRRGHWRRLRSGKIVWVRPCIINADGEKDTRIKKYRSVHDARL